MSKNKRLGIGDAVKGVLLAILIIGISIWPMIIAFLIWRGHG